MQRWKCHKVVEAFKIMQAVIAPNAVGGDVAWVMGKDVDVKVDTDYLLRNPYPIGGYFVRYNGGTPDQYDSWSPAKQFEEGYTPECQEESGVFFSNNEIEQRLDGLLQVVRDYVAAKK